MIILIHVILAISSVAYTALIFFKPTQAKLNKSYGLVAGTVATGTYLVVSTNSSLIQSCFTGLTYLAVVFAGIAATKAKLAKA